MAGSGAKLNPAEHLARHVGAYLHAYLGSFSPRSRAVLKSFDRAKVPSTSTAVEVQRPIDL